MGTTIEIEYQPIPAVFRRDIYTEFLIARQGDVVMYAITQSHGQGVRWDYEVMIVRRRAAGLAFGKMQPAKETLPSNEHFGRYGWHTPSWERAWEIFLREAEQRAAADQRRVHPHLEWFKNSIEVQLFTVKPGGGRPTPAGSMWKREPRVLDTIPSLELVSA